MKRFIDAEELISQLREKWTELAEKNVKAGGGKYDIEIATYLRCIGIVESLQQGQAESEFESTGVITNAGGEFGYDVAAFRFDSNHAFTILLPHSENTKHGDLVKLTVTKE